MNNPQRYDPDYRRGDLFMAERDDGDYVEYEDYAILAADLARLTAELDNAKIAIDGLQNTLRKEREQHHKAQDELERKQRECEGRRDYERLVQIAFTMFDAGFTTGDREKWMEQFKLVIGVSHA